MEYAIKTSVNGQHRNIRKVVRGKENNDYDVLYELDPNLSIAVHCESPMINGTGCGLYISGIKDKQTVFNNYYNMDDLENLLLLSNSYIRNFGVQECFYMNGYFYMVLEYTSYPKGNYDVVIPTIRTALLRSVEGYNWDVFDNSALLSLSNKDSVFSNGKQTGILKINQNNNTYNYDFSILDNKNVELTTMSSFQDYMNILKETYPYITIKGGAYGNGIVCIVCTHNESKIYNFDDSLHNMDGESGIDYVNGSTHGIGGGNGGLIVYSLDFGKTWNTTLLNDHVAYTGIAYNPKNKMFYVVGHENLYGTSSKSYYNRCVRFMIKTDNKSLSIFKEYYGGAIRNIYNNEAIYFISEEPDVIKINKDYLVYYSKCEYGLKNLIIYIEYKNIKNNDSDLENWAEVDYGYHEDGYINDLILDKNGILYCSKDSSSLVYCYDLKEETITEQSLSFDNPYLSIPYTLLTYSKTGI